MKSILLSLILCLSLQACQAKDTNKLKVNKESKLLLKVEEIDVKQDLISEYRFFDSGLMNSTVIHSSNKQELLNQSIFKELSSKELKEIQDYVTKLQNLDYHNSFPWKENLYTRGNTYKITFTDKFTLTPLKAQKKTDTILSQQTYYYYSGHKDSPKLFQDIVETIQKLR